MKLGLTLIVALLAVAAALNEDGAGPDGYRARALDLAKESDQREFGRLVDEWAKQKQYASLAALLPELAEATPEASNIVVRELLNAPAGTEFGPDIAEALIDYLDQSERIKGGGDEIESGRALVAYQIVVALESTFGIPAGSFDWEVPRAVMKYLDDAQKAVSRFPKEGKLFIVTEEGTGSAALLKGGEMIRINHAKEPTRNPSRESLRPPATASSSSLPAEVSSSNGPMGTGLEEAFLQKWRVIGGVLIVLLGAGWYFARRKKGA